MTTFSRHISLNFPSRISLKAAETMVALEALERYRRHCEQEIVAGEVWPLRRVIQTIRALQLEIGSRLLDIDAERCRLTPKAHHSPSPHAEMHEMTHRSTRRYHVTLDLDPDEFMALTEALTRFLAQCEQDCDNTDMKPFGSQINAGLSTSVRDNLMRAFRKASTFTLDLNRLMPLAQALARFLTVHEQDHHNDELISLGSRTDSESSGSARVALIQAFRKVLKKG